jgi:hypothetical protein
MNNLLSFSSVKLEPFSKEGAPWKPSSGFVVEAGGRYYLITNWHAVAGRKILADEQPEPTGDPYTVKISIHLHSGEGERLFPLHMSARQMITIPLYDDNGIPRWIEDQSSAQQNPMVDVVALPIEQRQIASSFGGILPGPYGPYSHPGPLAKKTNYWTKVSAIPLSAIETDVDYSPSDAIHIIGYPLGWLPEGIKNYNSAFWHTSFIASEIFEHGINGATIFFVAPGAPEGMTGSPVVGAKGDRLKLLGVYSDRFIEEFGANAGLVYDAQLVKKLVGAS